MKRFLVTAGIAIALGMGPAAAIAQSGSQPGGASTGASTGTMNNAGHPNPGVDSDASSDANARNCAGAGCTQPGEAGSLGASTNKGVSPGGNVSDNDNARNCAGAGCSQPGAENSAELPPR